MLFKKKKDDESSKPNKIKIQLTLDRSKNSIQVLLDKYQATINNYLSKMVALKREGRVSEAERYKQKLGLVMTRQSKMNDLMDGVEQFSYMIDEAFAKNDVYKSLGLVLAETNKISISPEIKKILKQVNEFDDIFTNGLSGLDAVFGKVTSKITDIDQATALSQDKELDAIISRRLEEYDRQTTLQAEEENDLFDLGGSPKGV